MRTIRTAAFAASALTLGAAQVGCSDPQFLSRFNPCLGVLNCDPLAYQDLFVDLLGGVDLDVDPTCTVPNRCGSIFPPLPGTGTAVQQPQQAAGAAGAGAGALGGLGGAGAGAGAGAGGFGGAGFGLGLGLGT